MKITYKDVRNIIQPKAKIIGRSNIVDFVLRGDIYKLFLYQGTNVQSCCEAHFLINLLYRDGYVCIISEIDKNKEETRSLSLSLKATDINLYGDLLQILSTAGTGGSLLK